MRAGERRAVMRRERARLLVLVSRSSCLFAQGAEYAAAVAQSIAEDNARAGPVFISGATGSLASVVNGYYEPTEEKGADGRVMYAKRGDGGVCIEHFEGEWHVKCFWKKGTSYREAYVNGGLAFESCASRVWKVYDYSEEKFFEQPSVKMVTGAEAERQVGFLCTRARWRTTRRVATRTGAAALQLSDALLVCFCRVLSMLLLLRTALPRTTRELGRCSSLVRRALWLRL